MVNNQDVYRVLKTIIPGSHDKNIVALGWVSSVITEKNSVGIVLDFGSEKPTDASIIRNQIESAITKSFPDTIVSVVMTVSRQPDKSNPAANLNQQNNPAPPRPVPIDGVRHIIAVASGKGGVGKSTTAANLAMAMAGQGLEVGLLDADIFGPSVPHIMGSRQKPTVIDNILQPVIAHGIKTMSIGYLLDTDQPVVWRGPRVMGATQQMLRDVAWGPLDILIIDLPPGTGDVQLTMVQQVPLTGAIIVSTPQDLALIDARKAVAMFNKVDVPILGLIENMSHFICPECGTESQIFGRYGAQAEAKTIGVNFLAGIPLDITLREQSDAGTPLVLSHTESKITELYHTMADKVIALLGT